MSCQVAQNRKSLDSIHGLLINDTLLLAEKHQAHNIEVWRNLLIHQPDSQLTLDRSVRLGNGGVRGCLCQLPEA